MRESSLSWIFDIMVTRPTVMQKQDRKTCNLVVAPLSIDHVPCFFVFFVFLCAMFFGPKEQRKQNIVPLCK